MIEDGDTIFRPLDDILAIKTDVEGFSKYVQVNIVELQLIKHPEWFNG